MTDVFSMRGNTEEVDWGKQGGDHEFVFYYLESEVPEELSEQLEI